jgi:hypothetical protein
MYIDPIHAGPVTLAQAVALETRAHTQFGASEPQECRHGPTRWRPFNSLRRFARWWLQLDNEECPVSDPVQLMLLSEPAGRPYATALSGLLLMDHIRRRRVATRQRSVEPR